MGTLTVQGQIGLNEEALTEWIEYRKYKKKPLSQFALDKSISFLLRYPEDHQQYLVDQAIMNDWQGLHFRPMENTKTTRARSITDDLTDTSWAT